MNREDWEKRVSNCNYCGNNSKGKIIPSYVEEAKLWVQCVSPGKMEVSQNKEWTQSLFGKSLSTYLVYLGVSSDEVYLTFSKFCALKESCEDRCKVWKKFELDRLGKLRGCLFIGNSPARQMIGPWAPSVVKIQGVIFPVDRLYGLAIPHPSYLQRHPELKSSVYNQLSEFGDLCGFNKRI